MSVCSVEFLALLILGSAIYPWIPTVRLRQLFLALANAGFLYWHLSNGQSWLALGLFVVSGYLISRLLQMFPSHRILSLYILILIAAFLVLKRHQLLVMLLPEVLLDESIVVVGISYLLFRQIHLAVDASQGQVPVLSFWTFMNYQLNLFGLIAGPIQRYPDFCDQWNSLTPVMEDEFEILLAYMRIFWGVIKIAFVARYCLNWYEQLATILTDPENPDVPYAWLKLVAVFYLYPFYLYFNFSGYCDIVIAGGRLYGIRLPENFNRPFLARNLIDYWTRWHITLGLWMRDYVFSPMYMSLVSHWPRWATVWAVVCYFGTFFLIGIWHGSAWNFVIFGALNGLGVSAAKLWEIWLIRRYGRIGFKAYLQSRPIRILATLGTFHFVCFTLFFFPNDLERTLQILTGEHQLHS